MTTHRLPFLKVWCVLLVVLSAAGVGKSAVQSSQTTIDSAQAWDGNAGECVDGTCDASNATVSQTKEIEACVDKNDQCPIWAADGECERSSEYMKENCVRSCTKCGPECEDSNENCTDWALAGECIHNERYMRLKCPVSCGLCGGENEEEENEEQQPCVDKHEKCIQWAESGECEENPVYMKSNCRASCTNCVVPINSETDFGEEQLVPQCSNMFDVAEVIDRSVKYMREAVMVKPEYSKVRLKCRNQHEQCSYWASIGECEKSSGYMESKCAPACQTCEKLDFLHRCPLDLNAPNAMQPGDLNKMFERIVTSKEYEKYNPTVLSRPPPDEDSTNRTSDSDYRTGPWVVTFDNFLSEEECDRLVALGHERGYKRSVNVGELRTDGTYGSEVDDTRTSTNAWCREECYEDPAARAVMDRMAAVTGVPEENSEYLQLLRYEEGQYYEEHHDYIKFHLDRQCGVRMLTFFLYLNDVEEGGGTRFPGLDDLIVKPKKGSALLWPSVLDSDPNAKDARTNHEAMPVKRGLKYGANAWLHMRDFKDTYKRNCLGG